MLSLILKRSILKMSILNVAQKNSIAKQAANILSRGSKRSGFTHSKFNPVYQFNDQNGKLMKFTSVRGHLFQYELPLQCKNWNQYDNKKILNRDQVSIIKSIPKGMDEIVKNIQELAKKSQYLLLWLDCDREGQAIAFQVIQICLKVNPRIKIKRARFSALTAADIWNAYNNLIEPNKFQADAVSYRIEIDFRLGCTFTRFQTTTFQKYYKAQNSLVLSYGPCQIPTLGFVVERYLQIKNFKSEKFWFIKCVCVLDNDSGVQFKWSRKNIKDQAQVNQILVSMFESFPDRKLVGKVLKKLTSEKKKYRPYPLTTVQLQKLATDKLKMSSAQIMEIAEALYTKGFISYPRTQTNSFPNTMNVQSLVGRLKDSNTYGEYVIKLLEENKYKKPKVGNQNDQAHSPIHPVKLGEKNTFSPKQWLVYDMICRHFLACCSGDARGDEFEVTADVGGQIFKASYLTIRQKNYLQIYPFDKWVEGSFPEIPDNFLPLVTIQEGKTTPPANLTESQLIGLMEKNQIGTDSTIHQHIQTIQTRQYAIKSNNTFKPTSLGVSIIVAYQKFQIKLVGCQVRRFIQQNMDQIANGSLDKTLATLQTLDMMVPIYQKLQTIQQGWMKAMKKCFQQNPNLQQLEAQTLTEEQISRSNTQFNNNSVFKCPQCNQQAKVRFVKNTESFFIGCSKYPTCKWSSSLPSYIKSVKVTTEQCPKCKTANLCEIEAKSIDLIQPPSLKYTFQQNPQLKAVLCIKPECNYQFNDFVIMRRNITENQANSTSNTHIPNRTNFQSQINNSSRFNNQNLNTERFDNTRSNNYSLQNITCYKCNEKGHYSKDCTNGIKNQYPAKNKLPIQNKNNSATNNQQKKFTCYKCGQQGHFANQCSKDNNHNNYSNKAHSNYSNKGHSQSKGNNLNKGKKVCNLCGVEGRHPKNSQCGNVKRKKNKAFKTQGEEEDDQ